ncbi:MAG: hypothetical protein AB4206_15495 [Xenococcaceae cyanobacterium]
MSIVYITGGKVWQIVNEQKEYVENSLNYTLDLKTLQWGQVNT